jgi:hypothetical protein
MLEEVKMKKIFLLSCLLCVATATFYSTTTSYLSSTSCSGDPTGITNIASITGCYSGYSETSTCLKTGANSIRIVCGTEIIPLTGVNSILVDGPQYYTGSASGSSATAIFDDISYQIIADNSCHNFYVYYGGAAVQNSLIGQCTILDVDATLYSEFGCTGASISFSGGAPASTGSVTAFCQEDKSTLISPSNINLPVSILGMIFIQILVSISVFN